MSWTAIALKCEVSFLDLTQLSTASTEKLTGMVTAYCVPCVPYVPRVEVMTMRYVCACGFNPTRAS